LTLATKTHRSGGADDLHLSTEELAAYREVKRAIGYRGREATDYREALIEHGRAPSQSLHLARAARRL